MSDETTADLGGTTGGETPAAPLPALVIAWSEAEPERVGEVAFVRGKEIVLGRGDSRGAGRLRFGAQSPRGAHEARSPEGKGISREQLRLRRAGDGVADERIGRCPMRVDGQRADRARVRPGSTILLEKQLLLLCVRRPALLPTLRSFSLDHAGTFGRPDDLGILGESVATWALREELAFSAASRKHVLVHGPSGSGKELAARAIHRLSARTGGPFGSRNAATVPAGVIDAEIFGNRRDYPNPGMPERAGLVGSADGGTLFLDEIGELPPELQAHLLRVLDAGEYQRLGDDAVRQADLRLVAATNRAVDELKHDLAARLTLRVKLSGLDERREDIPLLARHLVLAAAAESPALAARFVDGDQVRMTPRLVDALVRFPYALHVRELDGLLWRAMARSSGERLDLDPEIQAPAPEKLLETPPPAEPPSREAVIAALERAGGNQAHASRELGLGSRYAMYRLMKKYGIEAPKPGASR